MGRIVVRFMGWFFEQIGLAVENIAIALWRWVRQVCFGSWQRLAVTLVIASLVASQHFPEQVWPILAPLLQIAILLLAIRIMLIPFWPMGNGNRGRRRRRRSR